MNLMIVCTQCEDISCWQEPSHFQRDKVSACYTGFIERSMTCVIFYTLLGSSTIKLLHESYFVMWCKRRHWKVLSRRRTASVRRVEVVSLNHVTECCCRTSSTREEVLQLKLNISQICWIGNLIDLMISVKLQRSERVPAKRCWCDSYVLRGLKR